MDQESEVLQGHLDGSTSSVEVKKPETKDPIFRAEKVSHLKRADYNPRQISEWALEALRKSMMKFGDLSGITVNQRTGNLVGGHQRTRLFDPSWQIKKQTIIKDEVGTVAEGFIETPFGRWNYREVDWDEATEKAANIAANFSNKNCVDFFKTFDCELRCYLLKTSPEECLERRRSRGTSQNIAWVKGRATKALRFYEAFPGFVFSGQQEEIKTKLLEALA